MKLEILGEREVKDRMDPMERDRSAAPSSTNTPGRMTILLRREGEVGKLAFGNGSDSTRCRLIKCGSWLVKWSSDAVYCQWRFTCSLLPRPLRRTTLLQLPA